MIGILPNTPTATAMISLVESPSLDTLAPLLGVAEAESDAFVVCLVPELELRAEEPSLVEESDEELAVAAVIVTNTLVNVSSALKL